MASAKLMFREGIAHFKRKCKQMFESNDADFIEFISIFREYLRLSSILDQMEEAIQNNIPLNRPLLGHLHIENLGFTMVPHEDYNFNGDEAFIACISYGDRAPKISQSLYVLNDEDIILSDMANYVFPVYDKTDSVAIQLHWVTLKDKRTKFKHITRDIYMVCVDPATKRYLDQHQTKYKPNIPSIELTFDEVEFRFENLE